MVPSVLWLNVRGKITAQRDWANFGRICDCKGLENSPKKLVSISGIFDDDRDVPWNAAEDFSNFYTNDRLGCEEYGRESDDECKTSHYSVTVAETFRYLVEIISM